MAATQSEDTSPASAAIAELDQSADNAAVDLLAKCQIVDAKIDAHLRALIASAVALAPAGARAAAHEQRR